MTAAASTEQIDRGAQLKERIIRWPDAVHARDRVEDDLLLFRQVILDRRRKNDLAELDQASILRPMDRGVVYHIVVVRHLYENLEANGACRDALGELVEKEV